jgi:hypothetical protein
LIRGHVVQKALAASGARAAARNPALAELARNVQDLEKQIAAQLGVLNNTLALPPEQREDNAVTALQADIDKLRTQRDAAKRDLASRFPQYASLIEPRSPSVEEIRGVLKPDEAFLSFYFGQQQSFVWAVPKVGPAMFAAIAITAGDLELKIGKLREALEPQVETVEELPPFDLALAHELYRKLLAPVKATWGSARSLILVTNGALGLLPLGSLPTTPDPPTLESKPLFDGYRQVSWLARTHGVSQVPSGAALRMLRQLPPGPSERQVLIGFGDPYFSAEQAADAKQAAHITVRLADAGRGIPLRLRTRPQTNLIDISTAQSWRYYRACPTPLTN